MRMLEISDPIFARLQKLATPLVDTPQTVLERLLDHYERCNNERRPSAGAAQRPSPARSAGAQSFNPDSPPDLRHTRVLAARFGNRPASGWNKLVHAAHAEAFRRLGSLDNLRAVTTSNVMMGRPSSEEARKGYRHLPDINVSIQNVDAQHAWSNALRLARHLKVEVTVDFEWMDKSDAMHPGMKGSLAWKP